MLDLPDDDALARLVDDTDALRERLYAVASDANSVIALLAFCDLVAEWIWARAQARSATQEEIDKLLGELAAHIGRLVHALQEEDAGREGGKMTPPAGCRSC